ncbi:MAG: hypothetical protein CM1200mP20_04610 [Pseudomonadota bacterium]|nr:MAG: hypothetical protein CM1200mP20_04610 [Pseudomonadota bacterium]
MILGGGDSALDWVLEFADSAERVTIVHRRDEFRAAPASVNKMRELVDDPSRPVDCLIGRIPSYQTHGDRISQIEVAPFGEGESQFLELDELLVFYGLSPDLGPIAEWGLDIERKHISVSLETFQTNVPGIYAIGDINTYPGKKKLILSGFHEGALAAFAIQQYLDPIPNTSFNTPRRARRSRNASVFKTLRNDTERQKKQTAPVLFCNPHRFSPLPGPGASHDSCASTSPWPLNFVR